VTIPQAFQIALQNHQAGRLADAERLYRQILTAQPNHADALHLLGVIAHQAGRHDVAVELIRQSIAINPTNPFAYSNLGETYRAIGRLDEAAASHRRALELKPDYPDAHYNLGITLRDRGQLDESIAAYRRALQLKPNYPEAHNNLGTVLTDRGDLDEAIASYRRALQLKPDYPEAHNNLGTGLKDRGELDEAIAAYQRALQIEPSEASTHSNLIFALHLHPNQDKKAIFEEHQRWNRRFSDPQRQFVLPHANDRHWERRLRIGYVSPDFRDHAVGHFVLPLLENHDRERFEVFCYSGVPRPDSMTERFRALAAGWRNTIGVPDARLTEMIREDGVDILVDLTMHTAGNRLTMFARQPAPVQVAWLGYPGSTGLPGIGYRLTDARLEPPGEESAWSAEERIRLTDSWCCYRPAADSPEVNALPALSAERVIFGSLNNFAKVNEGVLARWARVLEAVQGSRLVMRCPEGQARKRVMGFFGARGIGMERLELVGYMSRWEYLKLYHRIDLALDPFPYNGTTTTCEALWMGTPVLTLPGAMPASRAGLSLLSSIGLEELVTYSEMNYLRLAADLAGNLPRLADLRASLRRRMQASPLMDAPRFARNVETAYRSMWERWRSGQSPIREGP
jgi:protein O-GlcNAc transferase